MEKYGVVELNTDEMMDISGGLGLLDTTAWALGALSDAPSKIAMVAIGAAIVATLVILKRTEAFIDGRL